MIPKRRTVGWGVLGLGGVLLLHAVLFLTLVRASGFEVEGTTYFALGDDAMISMRYAGNLAAGQGLVWNPGERVQGISNPGWTLYMAALHTLSVPRAWVSLLVQLSNLGIGLALLVFIFVHCRRRAGAPAALGAATLVAVSWPLMLWGIFGFAATLQALTVTAAFLPILPAGWRDGAELPLRPWPMLLWAAAAFAVRSDGIVIFFLAVVSCGGLAVARDRARQALPAIGTGGALVACVFLAQRLYYGSWLPNTAHHKLTGSEGLEAGLAYLRRSLLEESFYLPVFLAAAIYLGVGLLVRWRAFLPSVTVIAGWLGYVVLIGGDAFPFGRFLVPVVPLLAASAVLLLRELSILLCRPASPRRWRSRTARGVAALALSLLMLMFWRHLEARSGFLRPGWIPPATSVEAVEIALALRRAGLPVETTIGVFYAGVTPYFMPHHRFLDLLGRSDRTIARAVARPGPPGHNKWDYRYSLDRVRPELIIAAADFAHASDEAFERQVAAGADYAFHPALWLDPTFRARYASNRIAVEVAGRRLDQLQWIYSREGADLGRVELERDVSGARLLELVRVATELRSEVGLDSQLTTGWPVEGSPGQRWLWLGEGEGEGLTFRIRAATAQQAILELEVSPGPGREDRRRRLLVTVEPRVGEPRREILQLRQTQTLRLPLPLEPGPTEIGLSVLDRATVAAQPNGDRRALLVYLRGVTIRRP